MQMYDVAIDESPAYELLTSLWAFTARRERKSLDLGAGWVETVRRGLDGEFRARLDRAGSRERLSLPALLVWQCPCKQDVAGFLDWVGNMSPGDLYELLAPYMLDGELDLLRDLASWRDESLPVLRAWEKQYFRGLDPAIQAGLAADAAALRILARTTSPQDLVETATAGVCLQPTPGLVRVLLVPQYHYRPWNLNEYHRGLRIIMYPVDALATPPGELPPGLLRLTRALADENRLRILRLLASSPRSFTEVVESTRLAKSTVHYHLVLLRAAGLVRVHDAGESATGYSLRGEALDEVRARLGTFLQGGEPVGDRPVP